MSKETSLATLLLAERITTKTLTIVAANLAARVAEIDGKQALEDILVQVAARQGELIANPALLGVIMEPGLDQQEALSLARRDLVELIVAIMSPRP